jgi:O-antigen ligase
VLAAVLGASAAIGGGIDLIQTIPVYKSFASLAANRLMSARVAYFNVGLFGLVLAAVIPLTVGIVGRERLARTQPRTFALLLVILAGCLTALFLTFSKSAYLAATAGTVLVLVLLVGSWRRRAAIVLTVGVVSAIVIPWPALFLQAFPPAASAYRAADIALIGESRFDSWNPATLAGHGSMAERFYAVEGGVSMSLDHPLLGIGLDQFRTYYVSYGYKPPQATVIVDHAHSLLPEIAAELGLPAMILFMFIFAAALWAMRKVYRSPPDRTTRALAAGLAAAMVAWLIAATAFGVDIYRPDRALSTDIVVVAVIVAAALALARATAAATDSRPAPGTGGVASTVSGAAPYLLTVRPVDDSGIPSRSSAW